MHEYLKTLSDVDLLKTILEAAKAPPVSRRLSKAFDEEAKARGPERMAAARDSLGDAREAARQAASCAVCGGCEPVAAYGGWCCARVLQ